MFQKANLENVYLAVGICKIPFESSDLVRQAAIMHLTGHFESSFSLIVMYVVTRIGTNLKAER